MKLNVLFAITLVMNILNAGAGYSRKRNNGLTLVMKILNAEAGYNRKRNKLQTPKHGE